MSQRKETRTIQARQNSTEVQLRQLLTGRKTAITVELLKKMIFRAQDADFRPLLLVLINVFVDGDIDKLPDSAIETIQDAWNYFPHAALGGSCPAEVFFKQSGRLPPK